MSLPKSFLLAGLIAGCVSASAQSLVKNGSFENIQICPDAFYQIYKTEGWFSPDCYPLRPDTRGYAILFSGCSFGNTGVPKNVICEQEARTGTSYAGIEVVSAYGAVYRQYIETKMLRPMTAGRNYYFTMYYSLCEQYPEKPGLSCFNPDSTGVKFFTDPVDKNPNCFAIPVTPDVHSNAHAVKPAPGWTAIEGCYRAKGGEQYLMIGNYGGEKISNCSPVTDQAYFIFVDDVGLMEEVHNKIDTILCTTEKLVIDTKLLREEYKTMKGWKVQWSDGDTASVRTFSQSTTTALTVSLNGCFSDTYDYNIKLQPVCSCEIYVPNAFSPNSDARNDFFVPIIRCTAGELYNYHFTVFNRWGQKVFETRDKNMGWDGKHKNQAFANQVYAWVVSYDIMRGGKMVTKTLSGTVLAKP